VNDQRQKLPPPRNGRGGGQDRGEDTPWEQLRVAEKLDQLAGYLDSEDFRLRLTKTVPEFIAAGDRSMAAYAKQLRHGALMAAQNNLQLLDPKLHSMVGLIQGVVAIARRGLTIGDNVAWLVPYRVDGKPTVQVQLGYMGLYTLAGKAGLVTKVDAQAIFANDKRRIRLGTENIVEHDVFLDGPRGDFVGAYAIIHVPGDVPPLIEYMDKATVDYIRSKSPGKNSPAWRDWYDQMAIAKVFKRGMKKVPKPMHWDSSLFDDVDDAGLVIEGTGEVIDANQARLTHSAEQPINTVPKHQEREVVRTREFEDDGEDPPRQQQDDPGPGDDGGQQVSADAGGGQNAGEQEQEQPPRRGRGKNAPTGSLPFPED
jgi:recombination protein RecT